jgi:hypothetical protein
VLLLNAVLPHPYSPFLQEAAGSPDSNSLQAEACSAAETECLGGQEGIEVEPEPMWDPANISCCWLMHRGSSVRHPFP